MVQKHNKLIGHKASADTVGFLFLLLDERKGSNNQGEKEKKI
jgi:hypothetical protein